MFSLEHVAVSPFCPATGGRFSLPFIITQKRIRPKVGAAPESNREKWARPVKIPFLFLFCAGFGAILNSVLYPDFGNNNKEDN
ncbi:hypothetical protein [Fournierella sp.]|uniref:hypothetical protein n=1 Tax=Allofournierella sp. TaxID=1940256 RepID=UPI00307ADEF7